MDEIKQTHYVGISPYDEVQVKLLDSFWELTIEEQSKTLELIKSERKDAYQCIAENKEAKINAREWAYKLNTRVLEHFEQLMLDSALEPIGYTGKTKDAYLWSDIHSDNYIMRTPQDKRDEMVRYEARMEEFKNPWGESNDQVNT